MATNGQIIQFRTEGRIEFARVDLGTDGIERDENRNVEWFRVRQDRVTPFMVHVDDVVSHEQAKRERDAAWRS